MRLKYFTLTLFCLIINSLAIAQCPNMNITLSSQADIDDFATTYPGCIMIPAGVNIIIDDNAFGNINNLNGLSNLTSIGGDLVIVDNFALTDINGLSNLTLVGGSLIINSNENLTNLDGLSGLTSVDGNLSIGFHNELTNISGLSNLGSIGGDLSIQYNFALTNLDGLSNLTSVGGGVTIFVNYALINIDGLSSLTSIGGLLFINDNPLLINLDGLSNLTSVGGGIDISQNSGLMDIDGLSDLVSVGGNLFIVINSQLSMCCALCPLLQADVIDDTVISGNININNNANGCDESSILACVPCSICDLTIDTQLTPQNSCLGTDITFNVATSGGTAPITYQLQSDCVVAGTFANVGMVATSPMLTVFGATEADACNYRIVITDAAGCFVTSDVVALTIDLCAETNSCNCMNGLDLNGDGQNEYALETITFSGGSGDYIITNAMGLVGVSGLPLLGDDGVNLISVTNPLTLGAGVDIFTAFLLADGNAIYSVTFADANDTSNPQTIQGSSCGTCIVIGLDGVPTLSEWGLIILALTMLIVSVIGIREQRIFNTSKFF